MATISATATGVSPYFKVTAEEFVLNLFTTVTPINIDGVPPPSLGDDSGPSESHNYINLWYPWLDEKIVEPKYDGVAVYFGMPSNRPSYVKDYHMISLFRATDYVMQPRYNGMITATVTNPSPFPPPKANDQ